MLKFFFLLILSISYNSFAQFMPDLPEQTIGDETVSNIRSTPLSGNLKVVFIEYSFPDYPVSIAKYTNRDNPSGHYYRA